MASISDYKNKHQGEEAWLFAKGVGLDEFDFSEAGPLRMTINHACHTVPDTTYCFSLAGAESIQPPCPFFNAGEERFTSQFDEVDLDNNVFFQRHSSSELGASYAIYMGISKLHIVGMNPDHGNSENFPRTDAFIKKMLKFDRSPRSFYNDALVRKKTRSNCVTLASMYDVETVIHESTQPKQTFQSFLESVRGRLSMADRNRYDKWNKKKSKAHC